MGEAVQALPVVVVRGLMGEVVVMVVGGGQRGALRGWTGVAVMGGAVVLGWRFAVVAPRAGMNEAAEGGVDKVGGWGARQLEFPILLAVGVVP